MTISIKKTMSTIDSSVVHGLSNTNISPVSLSSLSKARLNGVMKHAVTKTIDVNISQASFMLSSG